VHEFKQVGNLIGDVLDGLATHPDNNEKAEAIAQETVKQLCDRFPVYKSI
jgi:glycine hydroxymethyltransferase